MAEEIITLIGVFHPNQMDINVNVDSIEHIISEGASLACYLPHLRQFLKPIVEGKKFTDIQSIFKALDAPEFWQNVRQLANGFETELNIKLIKAALYLYSRNKITIPLMKIYYNAYVLLDFESMRNGAKQDPGLLQRSFILVNRFLPLKLISLWLEHNTPYFKRVGVLAPHEYLFLAANTHDRSKLIEERLFSQPALIITKDSNTKTFHLSETASANPDLDKRLEKIMNSHINASNVIFEPEETLEEPPPIKLRKFSRKSRKATQNAQMNEFKTLLRDPNLYDQIKQTLFQSSWIVNKSKTNEKFSYQRMRATCGILNSSRPHTAKVRTSSDKDIKNKRALTDFQLPIDELDKANEPHHRYIVSFRDTDIHDSSINLTKNNSDVQVRPFSATTTTTYRGTSRGISSRPMTGKSSRPFTANSMVSTAVSLKLREEPYHVCTLREAMMMSEEPKQKSEAKKIKVKKIKRWRY